MQQLSVDYHFPRFFLLKRVGFEFRKEYYIWCPPLSPPHPTSLLYGLWQHWVICRLIVAAAKQLDAACAQSAWPSSLCDPSGVWHSCSLCLTHLTCLCHSAGIKGCKSLHFPDQNYYVPTAVVAIVGPCLPPPCLRAAVIAMETSCEKVAAYTTRRICCISETCDEWCILPIISKERQVLLGVFWHLKDESWEFLILHY